ncbi:hypothetical protein ACJX0J_039783, partial [Zea mays]
MTLVMEEFVQEKYDWLYHHYKYFMNEEIDRDLMEDNKETCFEPNSVIKFSKKERFTSLESKQRGEAKNKNYMGKRVTKLVTPVVCSEQKIISDNAVFAIPSLNM